MLPLLNVRRALLDKMPLLEDNYLIKMPLAVSVRLLPYFEFWCSVMLRKLAAGLVCILLTPSHTSIHQREKSLKP